VRGRARLCVELGAMNAQWENWCAERGVSSGEGVRLLIGEAVGDVSADAHTMPDSGLRWTAIGEHRARVEIRLTSAELNAVEQRAAASGFTANRWIVALIRARLTGEPQFGEREMMLLAASNQQLAMVGRMLNRISRERDVLPGNGETLDRPLMVGMKEQIDAHLRVIAELVRANLERWSR
jgi:hypothetical protein